MNKIRRFNVIAGFFHLVQFVAVMALANSFSLPVTATYLAGPPGTQFADPITLFNVRVGWGVALFLLLSAFFHFVVASPQFFNRYQAGLEKNQNIFRWVEYSISSSVMIVLIAQITGIADFAALIGIFFVNATMIWFGWLQEKYTNPGTKDFLPFIFGSIAGLAPWLIILIAVLAPGSTSTATAPGFVYGIVVSLFLFFNSFALVQYWQYKQKGKWSNYLYGERAYIILSLVAKSALAWQIFSGTLIPQ
jgi:hypothetical protein